MTDETTTTAAPAAEIQPTSASPAAPKKGRGPTRPSVRFADAVEAAGKLDTEAKKTLDAAIRDGRTSKMLLDDVKLSRRAHRELTNEREAAWKRDERAASILDEVEALSPELRRAFIAAITAEAPNA